MWSLGKQCLHVQTHVHGNEMHFLWLLYVQSPFPIATCQVSHWSSVFAFSPRASQRRVLLTVGVCQTFSHLHIFPSHLQILTSSHPHILTSSHPHIFTSSHLHICSSSHLLILTSSHLHIFSSSHLHIFSSSHLHILTSSHLHILTSSHLLIFTSSHLHITSSHLHIFSSSHLHMVTSSHIHMFTSSYSLLPSCSLALFFLLLFYFSLKARGSANETARNAKPFRTKQGWIAKN